MDVFCQGQHTDVMAWTFQVILALYGSKCRRCGTPQYPPQRICVNPDCGVVDEMEDYRFSDKRGVVFSYTADHAASSVDPPLLYGVIDSTVEADLSLSSLIVNVAHLRWVCRWK